MGFYISDRSVITVMPSDCHCGINLSISIMFVCARYIAGIRSYLVAVFFTVMIGDGHTRPAANQLSVSTTQKSGSSWVMMACVSVMITFSSDRYGLLCWFRYSINSELSFVYSLLFVSGVLSGVSKLISVNVGMSFISGDAISKSVGNGRPSNGGVVSGVVTGVFCMLLNADV